MVKTGNSNIKVKKLNVVELRLYVSNEK